MKPVDEFFRFLGFTFLLFDLLASLFGSSSVILLSVLQVSSAVCR